jgi:hypothetical protein
VFLVLKLSMELCSTNLLVCGLPNSARVDSACEDSTRMDKLSMFELSASSVSPTVKPLRKSIRNKSFNLSC